MSRDKKEQMSRQLERERDNIIVELYLHTGICFRRLILQGYGIHT